MNAVKATGRKKLVMAGLVTSVCLAYPAVHAIAEGYQVAFVEDAVGDISMQDHNIAVMRLVQAGAVPSATAGMIIEWFRDWASPLARHVQELLPPYVMEVSKLKGLPPPHGAADRVKSA